MNNMKTYDLIIIGGGPAGLAAAVAAKDLAAAQAALKVATATIESACSKGVYHKNNAARKVSRVSKAVNSIA